MRAALEGISVIGDTIVTKNSSAAAEGPEWHVTFLNNAGNLPILEADTSALWGGVSITVAEEREGTSTPVSGSFELGSPKNMSERVMISYDASATEVRK